MTRLKLFYYSVGALCCRIGLLVFVASFLLLTGCKTVKTSKDTETLITDTIYKDREVIVRDTVFVTEPAKVKAAVPAKAFEGNLNPIKKQFKNANLDIHKKGDTVYIECACDTIAIKAQLREVFEKEYRARSELTKSNTLEKQEQSRFEKFMVSCGYLFWIIAIIGTIYFITKRK